MIADYYTRCSTREQAEHGISILAQESAIKAYADQHGVDLGEGFSDAGYSGSADSRPGLKRLLAKALTKGTPTKAILIFAGSRLFRDRVAAGWYRRQLLKNGVQVISVTETYTDDPEGQLAQGIIEMVDDLARQKNAIGVHNAMLENARQGFCNGSRAPLGFKKVVAEVRGDKEKKKFAKDDSEAELIELIFRLCIEGDGASGPMGIKTIAAYVNSRAYRTREGKRFARSSIEKILKNEAYIGVRRWNVFDPKTKKQRPESEWITGEMPRIVSDEVFQAAQIALRQRAPKVTAPRITNSNVLLTGLAYCECGARMILTTSNGRTKLYRYYCCSAQYKNNSCTADGVTRVPEDKLDALVMEAVADQVLQPDFAFNLVNEAVTRRRSSSEQASQTLDALRRQLAKATSSMTKLMEGYSNGVYEDSDVFRSLQRQKKEERDNLRHLVDRQERLVSAEPKTLSRGAADLVVQDLKAKIATAAVQFKKRFLRAVLSVVVVRPGSIEVIGTNAGLMEALTGTTSGAMVRSEPLVRGSDREWWSRGEAP